MKILLIDYTNDLFYMQKKFLQEGHTILLHFQLVTSKDMPVIIEEDNVHLCSYLGLPENRLRICNGYEKLEKAYKECDFIFYSPCKANVRLDNFIKKLKQKEYKPIINDKNIEHTILELDRFYAKSLDLGFDNYEIHRVYSYEEYKKIKSNKLFVIKAVNENSSKMNVNFRTIIPQSKIEEDEILKTDKYNHFASGGVVLEEYIKGTELCTGFYWDGSKIVGDLVFINQEYKGVWDNDLGGILCGECGSAFYPTSFNKLPSRIKIIISNLINRVLLESFRDYHGFIDMNFMMSKGKIYLLEFTVRSGYPTEPILYYIIKDYSKFMRCVATGEQFKGKAIRDKYIVAVSMFHYGVPLLNNKNVTKLVTGNFDNKNVVIACAGNISKTELIVNSLDRPIVVVSEGNSVNDAKNKVYKTLRNIHSLGFVYRSDIGDKFNEALSLLKKVNSISEQRYSNKSKGFSEEYFKNYGYEGDTSYEASINIADVIFNPAFSLYKKMYKKVPETYVELGCGNGYYINKMLKAGVKSCVGCDFSNHFDKNIVCPKKLFFKDDSINFLKKINYKIDMVYENTCQYLSSSELDELFSMLKEKVRKGGIVAIAYDESDNFHLYRKQKHTVKEWKTIMKRYGFKPTKSQYVFVKE